MHIYCAAQSVVRKCNILLPECTIRNQDLGWVGGKALVVLSLGIDQGQVRAIWVIGNPDKLQSFNRVLHDAEEEKE